MPKSFKPRGILLRKIRPKRLYKRRKPVASLKTLTSQVKNLRSKLNVEKKRVPIYQWALALGQVSANADGSLATEITPLPSQGAGAEQRNGASICLKSQFVAVQFKGQASQTHRIQIRWYIVQTNTGDNFTMSEFCAPNQWIYNSNSSTEIYDANSFRHPDYLNKYKVLRTGYATVDEDSYSGQANFTHKVIKLNYGVKGIHIRFNKDSNTPTGARIFLVMQASSGNCSSTDSTLTQLPITTNSTGTNVFVTGTSYYIDN